MPLTVAPRVNKNRSCKIVKDMAEGRRYKILMSELSAQHGDTVSVRYLGKFPGGKVFATSMKSEAEKAGLFSPARDYKPLQVVLGAHQVIQGFEKALVGMKINETKRDNMHR